MIMKTKTLHPLIEGFLQGLKRPSPPNFNPELRKMAGVLRTEIKVLRLRIKAQEFELQ